MTNLDLTPRTDAEAKDGWSGDACAVSCEFAESLERETNALRHMLESALNVMSDFHSTFAPDEDDADLTPRTTSEAFRTFVDAHASLVRRLAAKGAAEPTHDCPAAGMDINVRGVCSICDAIVAATEPQAKPDEFLAFLDDWALAYPLDLFPLPDFIKAAAVLKEAGLSLDQISAANFRHVINRARARYAENREGGRDDRR